MYDVGGASSGECFADLVGIGVKVLPQTIEIGIGLLWLSAIVTLYTGWDYLRAGLRYMMDD